MSKIKPTEERFEEHIEKELKSVGYESRDFKDYDKIFCLIQGELINFLKITQKDSWD